MRVRIRQGTRTERVELPNDCSHAAACDLVAGVFSIPPGSVRLSLNNRDAISSDLRDAGVCGGDLLYLMDPSSVAMPGNGAVVVSGSAVQPSMSLRPAAGASGAGPSVVASAASDRDLRAAAAEHRLSGHTTSGMKRRLEKEEDGAGTGSSSAAPPPDTAFTRQSVVLAFASSGSSVRQREASWAGLLPPDMHTLILEQLPVTPEYANITGVVGTVGNGWGTGPGQFNDNSSMRQVSFGSDSTVWAVDQRGHRVHHFKQSGELIKTIGTGTAGTGPGELKQPRGVAVSRLSSSVFIGEYYYSRISEFNQSDGAFVRVLDTRWLNGPDGICLSPDETTLAVACPVSHCIKLISVGGSVAPRTIGGEEGSEDGQLSYPCDVRFTPDGQHVVVADYGNKCVQCLAALDGSFVRKMPLGAVALAVAVDAAGNIIAATDKHVKVFSPEGTLLLDRLGGLEMREAAYGGLTIDPGSGRIAVGDMETGKVTLL